MAIPLHSKEWSILAIRVMKSEDPEIYMDEVSKKVYKQLIGDEPVEH